MSRAAYDGLGVNYSDFRRADPRIAGLSPEAVRCGQERLRADLASGRWDEKYGLRLVCEEL